MKVVFVTPRYGPEIMGGAESASRLLAEHLAAQPGFEVAAYSTCALDHLTWENDLAPGETDMNGVTLTRFTVARERQEEFFGFDGKLRRSPRHVTRAHRRPATGRCRRSRVLAVPVPVDGGRHPLGPDADGPAPGGP